MKSLSLAYCREQGHKPGRFSPNGVDVIVECPDCCKAWLIQGITGRETRLEGSSYERRLMQQRLALPSAP